MTASGATVASSGTYAYTARGTPSSESSPSGTLAVTFDAYGDQATAGTRAYAYDALGRLAADTPASGGGGYAFSYVGSTGTIASDGTSAYAWDPSGSVLAATGAPGGGTGGALALTDIHGNQAGQFTASGASVAGAQPERSVSVDQVGNRLLGRHPLGPAAQRQPGDPGPPHQQHHRVVPYYQALGAAQLGNDPGLAVGRRRRRGPGGSGCRARDGVRRGGRS
jgi:hypothetical protein